MAGETQTPRDTNGRITAHTETDRRITFDPATFLELFIYNHNQV